LLHQLSGGQKALPQPIALASDSSGDVQDLSVEGDDFLHLTFVERSLMTPRITAKPERVGWPASREEVVSQVRDTRMKKTAVRIALCSPRTVFGVVVCAAGIVGSM
jgi:hypothetical protein